MKKILLFAVLILSLLTINAYAAVKVEIDGEQIDFADCEPEIIDGTTMVPLRAIFEKMGAYVDWDNDTQTVYAYRRLNNLVMTVGEVTFRANGKKADLLLPAMIKNNRTLVPLRAVSETFGCDVGWNQDTETVTISNLDYRKIVSDSYITFSEPETDVKLTGLVAYPTLNNPDEKAQIKAVNDYFEQYANQNCNNAKKELNNTSDIPYLYEQFFDVPYIDDDIVSVLYLTKSLTNDLKTEYSSLNINLNSGRVLKLEEYSKLNYAKLRKRIANKISELAKKSPNEFYTDADDCIDRVMKEYCWYIQDKKVHIKIAPEVISYASYGAIDFEL